MRTICIRFAVASALITLASLSTAALSADMMAIPELLTHAEQYDRQMVTVTGRVSDLQMATNREGQLAYGFLLKDANSTLKVVVLGKAEIRDGDQVIVEGVFSRLRQVGRSIIYNEIKATVVRPMDRLNPDLVG